MRVAIQGAPGSFSDAAARCLLNGDAELLSCATFDELFDAVGEGRAERGVVPVRNTIMGRVYDNEARARSAAFRVIDSISYPVRQCLIGGANSALSGVRRVASHPVALRQCTRFFESRPDVVRINIADGAGGVRDLMLGTLMADAVIAPSQAAVRYGAQVLIEGVEDDPSNRTDFLLIARLDVKHVAITV